MPDMRFDGPPGSGIQVSMTNSGSKITPYRVTVTESGRIIRQVDFGQKSDAKLMFDHERAAINAGQPKGG